MVFFDVYMFKPEYVEIIRRREIKADPSLEEKFIPEIGGMFCLNTARRIAMRFFGIDEALDLILAGYQVAVETGQNEPMKVKQMEYFPDEMVNRTRIELSGEFVGELKEGRKKTGFKNRDELKQLMVPLAAKNQ